MSGNCLPPTATTSLASLQSILLCVISAETAKIMTDISSCNFIPSFNPNLSHMLHSKLSSNENRNRRRKKTEWGNQGWREAGCNKPERHEAWKKRPTEREREVKTLCTPMGDTCLCTHGWVIDLCSYSLPSTQNKKELLWFGPNFRLRNGFAPTHHNKAQILSVCLCEWVGGRFIHQTEQTIDTHTLCW